MKKSLIKITGIFSLIFVLAISFTSCEDFEKYNLDDKALIAPELMADAAIIGGNIPAMQNNINSLTHWIYQLQHNLNADVYSGYMATSTPFAGNVNNLTYAPVDGWNGFILSVPFNQVFNAWLKVKEINESVNNEYEGFLRVADIVKIVSAHKVVDVFGPIPYIKYGEGTTVPFDNVKDIYYAFFDELDVAINYLTSVEKSDPEKDTRFHKYDKSSLNGDFKAWVQFANTLRLRLALRVVKIDPAKAQEEADKSLTHEFGLLESVMEINHSFDHPLAVVSNSWGDTRMGAPMDSYLNGFGDNRISAYFTPATDTGIEGQYRGIRQGIDLPEKATYNGFSAINLANNAPMFIMSGAESFFLKAECALRGWNVGGALAADLYAAGIKKSFEEHEVSGVDDYLNSVATPANWIDHIKSSNSINALSNITPKWDATASNEVKLERIITQKWIANFPCGQEAWSEFRRTGFPKLFPVAINNSTDIPAGEFIKRLSYPADFLTTNGALIQTAIDNDLGGKNSVNTRLWWDTTGGNF